MFEANRGRALVFLAVLVALVWGAVFFRDSRTRDAESALASEPVVKLDAPQQYQVPYTQQPNPVNSPTNAPVSEVKPVETTTTTTAPKPPVYTSVNDSVVGNGPSQIRYSGPWAVSQREGKFQGDDHHSELKGASFTMNFTGTGVALFGAKDAHHGKASVSIDNGAPTVVDYFAPTRSDNVDLFNRQGLSGGNHTITVTVLGTNSSGSNRYVVTLDRFVVTT